MRRSTLLAVLVAALLGGLAFSLRFHRLLEVPPGFYMDEASVGVEAHHIATEGKDSRGQSWPVIFPALQDWKHPIAIYATALSEKVLGPTRLAVRLPLVLFGTATVLLLGLVGLELFRQDPRVGVLSALFLAVMPWHVHYSRVWEVVTLDFTVVLALWLYLRARRKETALGFVVAGAAFGLVLYSYVAAKLLLPAFLAAIFVLEVRERRATRRLHERLRREAEKSPAPPVDLGLSMVPDYAPPVRGSHALLLVLTLLLVCAPMVVEQVRHFAEIRTRFDAVSVFREARPLEAIARGYVAHLDPGFLFVRGDANPRHGLPGFGLLLIATSPFVAIALLFALARRELQDLLLLAWLVVYPLGACLTSEGVPHATRSFFAAPLFALLAARGLTLAADRFEVASTRLAVLVVSTLLVLGNAAYFFREYFENYARKTGVRWTAGVEELVPKLLELRGSYRRVHFMQPPYADIGIIREHIVFFSKFDPSVDLSWFDLDDKAKGAQYFAHLPKDELIVSWPDQLGGIPPVLRVTDDSGRTLFEVYRGLGVH